MGKQCCLFLNFFFFLNIFSPLHLTENVLPNIPDCKNPHSHNKSLTMKYYKYLTSMRVLKGQVGCHSQAYLLLCKFSKYLDYHLLFVQESIVYNYSQMGKRCRLFRIFFFFFSEFWNVIVMSFIIYLLAVFHLN